MKWSYNQIPADKLNQPLTIVLMPGASHVMVYDSETEAKSDAAVLFSNGSGKSAVLILRSTEVAMPAIPKVEFTPVKEKQ